MKPIKSLITLIVLFALSSTAFALDAGDRVYYLHGPNNSALSISEARVISSTDSQILVRTQKNGQNLRFNSASLFTTWQDADAYRDELDAGHVSKGEMAGGVALLAIFGICRAMGEC